MQKFHLNLPEATELMNSNPHPCLSNGIMSLSPVHFMYLAAIHLDNVLYHEADCWLKWPGLAKYSAYLGTLKCAVGSTR